MKKIYIEPFFSMCFVLPDSQLLIDSISGETGDGTIGNGGDDEGGEHDPDVKQRNNLWSDQLW